MIPRIVIAMTAAVLAIGQDAPIYRVTVIERTMKAINYEYRTGPTAVDFRGTVLLPKAKGQAIIESKQGRTEIDARFQNLTSPQGFGLEYMTYVLWAVTPEGRPRNLGEIVVNSSNKATLHVTTDLKAFGLLVAAEPYSAVRQPSDVVVAENQVREDTVGKVEEVNVKYELMPRGHYTWNASATLPAEVANAPKVSMRKYEALLELYQAQNAIAIARKAGAGRYAAETLAKAQALLNEAEQLNSDKNADSHRVVDSAREAAQTAEDARQVAEHRMREDQLAQASAKTESAFEQRANAEAEARRARADASAAQAQADAERAARLQAEAEIASARERAEQAIADARRSQAAASQREARQEQTDQFDSQKAELRMRLLEQLKGSLDTRDTAWGLMVTVPDARFSGSELLPLYFRPIRQVSEIVAAHPGLRVTIEAHSDSPGEEARMLKRAQAVRNQLAASGLPLSGMQIRPMGESRPLGSNKTETGREQNRRVEIILSGDPIGSFPFWNRPYSLTTRR